MTDTLTSRAPDNTVTTSSSTDSSSFHPRYPYNQNCDPNGHLNHIVLQSSDGIKFGIESVVLRLGSDFFARMLEIPREQNESNEEPIPMAESSRVVSAILDILHPHSSFIDSSSLTKFDVDFTHQMLAAAEKYEIPKIGTFLRIHVMQFLTTEPLEIYSISTKFGWTEERRASSVETMKLGFQNLAYLPTFLKLSAEGIRDLCHLQAEVQRRFWQTIEKIKTQSTFSFMFRNRDYSKTFDNLSRHLYVEFEKKPFDKQQIASAVFTDQPSFIAFCDVVVGQRSSISSPQVAKGDVVRIFMEGIEEMLQALKLSAYSIS